jgi:hypothetical protein
MIISTYSIRKLLNPSLRGLFLLKSSSTIDHLCQGYLRRKFFSRDKEDKLRDKSGQIERQKRAAWRAKRAAWRAKRAI